MPFSSALSVLCPSGGTVETSFEPFGVRVEGSQTDMTLHHGENPVMYDGLAIVIERGRAASLAQLVARGPFRVRTACRGSGVLLFCRPFFCGLKRRPVVFSRSDTHRGELWRHDTESPCLSGRGWVSCNRISPAHPRHLPRQHSRHGSSRRSHLHRSHRKHALTAHRPGGMGDGLRVSPTHC
jgi:hypothetical protein